MKNFLVLGFMSILGLGFIPAQDLSVIHGQVYDMESKNPLTQGLVNLIASDSLQLLSFELIDANGEFRMELPADFSSASLLLSVEALGYEPLLIKPDSFSGHDPFKVYLKPLTYSLEEVIIEDIPPVRQSVDTISFDPRSYMDSTERNLEDILRKLPGVDVSADGKISIGNRAIQSILLDGDDLSGSDYRVISQNLPVELVKRLEFVSNYVENSLLAGFDVPEALILNVQLHEEKAQRPSLNLDLSIGNANSRMVSANSLAFWKRLKFINILQHQTLGEPVFPPLTQPWQELQSVMPPHPLIRGESREWAYGQPEISIPSSFIPYRFNSTTWGISRIHFRPSGKWKAFLEIGIDGDRTSRFMDVERTFLVGEEEIGLNENYTLGNHVRNFRVQVKNQLSTGKNSNLTYFSRIDLGREHSFSELALGANEFDISFSNQSLRQDHKLAWIKRLDTRQMLILDLGYSSAGFTQGLKLRSPQPRTTISGDTASRILQGLRLNMNHVNANVRWLWKLNQGLSLHAAWRFASQRDAFLSGNYVRHVANADLKLRYSLPQATILILQVQPGYMKLAFDALHRTASSAQVPFFYATVALARKMLKRAWGLSYSFRQVLPRMDQINLQPFWINYRTLSQGENILRIGHSHNIHGNMAFNSDLSKLNRFASYVNLDLSLGYIPYQLGLQLDSALLLQRWQLGDSEVGQADLKTGAERYVPFLKSAIKFRPGFRYATFNNRLDDEERRVHSFNVNVNYSLRTATSSPFDLMVGGETSWNWIQVSAGQGNGLIRSFSASSFGDLMVHLPRKIEFVFRNEWLMAANRGQKVQNFHFQEAELSLPGFESSRLKIGFELAVKNLGNVAFYGINSATDYFTLFHQIRLRPRTFLLKANLDF